ncbi:GntR family transcriptional regulator [Erythrobacter westpacificensis]|uniref:GntR family transcriptional regulator n=1 Tax=Erythrobacter westpacificensis TaxID=1055231 RepID=UPI0031FA168E
MTQEAPRTSAGAKPENGDEPAARPVEGAHQTLAQKIYLDLRADIMMGRIGPGESLTIRGLATHYAVSAMPVREALRRLISEQALEMQDNRRVRIATMTMDRFEDLLAARVTLETEAAMRAFDFIDKDRLTLLEQIDEELTQASKAKEYDRWMERNLAFHSCIYEARPASAFVSLIESVWLQMGPFMRRALVEIRNHYPVDRHIEALQAIRNRDRLALKIAIEADIRDGISHIGSQLINDDARNAASGKGKGNANGRGGR